MTESAQQPPAVEATDRVSEANKRALALLFGAQRLILEEIVFGIDELFDRARTETHLFAEFLSKLAEAHSVQSIKMMYDECTRHQVDFIRRDCERFFKNSQRVTEKTSDLLGKGLQS